MHEKNSSIRSDFSIGEKESFLIHYLHHRKLEWKIDQPVKNLFDNYQKVISDLKKLGYLMDDDHSFFLEEMHMADLKAILKKLSLPVSGKKSDLIERITKNTTSEERAVICPDLYYVLTECGLKVEEEYINSKKEQNAALKEDIFNKIKAGMYEEASLAKADAYSKEVIPPGIGVDWSDHVSVKAAAKREQEFIRQYDFSDLNNSNNYKETLFQILYFDNEIGNNLIASIEKFVNACDEKMNCQDLDRFFHSKGYLPSETEKVFVYLDTKRFNVFQQNMKNISQSEKHCPLPKGEFHVSNQTISLWRKLREDKVEFERLAKLGIEKFPKTFQTFQKHKDKNDGKYQAWINCKGID